MIYGENQIAYSTAEVSKGNFRKRKLKMKMTNFPVHKRNVLQN